MSEGASRATDSAEEIRRAVSLARPLPAAGIPALAVLGNRDDSLNHGDDLKREQLTTPGGRDV